MALALSAVAFTTPRPIGAVNFVIIQPDDLHFYEAWSPPPYLPWDPNGRYPGEDFPGTSTLPWINKLRESGLYMTQAYAASPKCGTSRYSTVTGRYASRSSEGRKKAIRSGVTDPSDVSIGNTKLKDDRSVVDGNDCSENNLAQVFKNNDYVTGMVGKWHLSKTANLGDTVEAVKAEIESCGFMDVEAMYPDNFQDFDTWSSNIDHNMEYVAYKAVEFIEENANNDFFLYVNPTAPHSPDVLTAMSKDCRITVDGDFRSTMSTGWSVEGMTKEFGDDCMLYRANVRERAQSTSTHDLGSIWVDDAVGAIYKALERTSQLDDTVILFQLDHGKAGKDEIWEGGIRIPQFIHYPNGFGTASRTWDGMVSTIDVGPTFLDYAGISESNPHMYPMDGRSWKNAIDNILGSGDDWKANRCLFFESSEERSVRCGCDKYFQLSSSSPEKAEAAANGWPGWNTNTAEALVDLCDTSGNYVVADLSVTSPEAVNIIASEPQKAFELSGLLQCHLDKTKADVAPTYFECGGNTATPPPTPATLPPTPAPSLRGTTINPTNPPEEDTTPPIVHFFNTEAGTYLTTNTPVFHVWASDDSSIRSVKFQLRDPSGNIRNQVNGDLAEVSIDHEKWASPQMTLDESGEWAWRARVTDNSAARNQFLMPWVHFHFLGGDSPVAAAVGIIRAEIEELINGNNALRPKFLRLGFHDCVGGCDGCVNMDNGDNAGLDVPIDALVPIVEKYAHNAHITAAIGSTISRADIWALATLAGVDLAAGGAPSDVTWSMTHIGRVDCSGADAAGKGGPDPELPSPNLNTHELLDFFEQNFGFSSDETVAIMGAHSIGAAQRQNSGFDGPHGWVNNPNQLSNGYYDMIM
uniref:Plant heme peroxidase family profile domain-containing protein n=4 Tax=Ditylum brightwellii TaxID=49249 RepID=A0A7S4SA90_9STRA